MDGLKISLVAAVHVADADCSSESKALYSVQALLAHLLLQDHRSRSRDVLTRRFWGEHGHGQARSYLSTTLGRLQGVLEPRDIPRDTYLTITPRGAVQLGE